MKEPDHSHWNHFWSIDQTKKFTQVSWSKKRMMDVLSPFVRPGQTVLDAGCGSGFFSKYFCDQGMTTCSLDYSDSALNIAQKMTDGRSWILKKDLVSGSLSREIEDRFDLIFSDGLLEHFSSQDQDQIIQNFLSLLSPKGVVVTFVPNRFSPWEIIRPFYMPGIEEEPFVLNGLVDLNRRNGLKVISQGGVNTFPFAFSPDRLVGSQFGMLLYTISSRYGV